MEAEIGTRAQERGHGIIFFEVSRLATGSAGRSGRRCNFQEDFFFPDVFLHGFEPLADIRIDVRCQQK